MAIAYPDCTYCKKGAKLHVTRYSDTLGINVCKDNECLTKAFNWAEKDK